PDPHRGRADREPRSDDLDRDHEAARLDQPARHHGADGHTRPRDRRCDAAARDRARQRDRRPRSRTRRLRVRGSGVAMAIKIDYAVQESVTNIRRNMFITIAAILVVGVSLFLGGSALLLQHATARASDQWTSQVEVAVFLTSDISPDERDQLQSDLQAMPEVRSVTYESKAQAYERFKRLFANQPDIVNNTSPDALPESFRVKLKDPHQFGVIRDRLDGRPGVYQIRDEHQTVHELFKATETQRKMSFWNAIIVFIAATILIATTIRMAIFSRRKEIGIMKLVGATNWFVRIPFT